VSPPCRVLRAIRTILLLAGGALLGGGALILAAHWWVQRAAGRYVIGQLAGLPPNDVGLVLGTSSHGKGDARNPHFDNRMAAAATLFHPRRVGHLLLSGNGAGGSAEPTEMQRALAAQGVPSACMTRDDAGFRTLDSVVRARRVFGLRRVTIITDGFHCYRAVFLARQSGLDAVAFPSEEVNPARARKTRLREWLADVRACIDVYVVRTQPTLLGPPVVIGGFGDKPLDGHAPSCP
jgi:SanA protein